ncbi:DUF4102 domain-containing protein [Salmonella enterica]|nr:DUF4102 domain-containing protein [Salmonella enterica]ELB6409060.1 integrase arm-type DNA-binding domain-containing protein [Salmonella enterica]
MKLTDTKIRKTKPDTENGKIIKLSDGNGLYCWIDPNGSRYWRFRKVINGKETTRALGKYPIMSLADARAARDAYLADLAKGIDPRRVVPEKIITFEEIARTWHERKKKGWDEDHAASVLRGLEKHIFPVIGNASIKDLTTPDLLVPLRIMEGKGILETTARQKQRINNIMRYAVQCGYIKYNPAQELEGAIEVNKTTHHPGLPADVLPDFLKCIDGYFDNNNGRLLTQYALILNLLIFIRSSELRFARWNEIDFDNALWTIPAKRIPIPDVKFSHRGSKMKTPHNVPLPRQAVKLLKEIKNISGDGELIFPGDHHESKPMSENTINKALRNLGYDTKKDVCGHGFRNMACAALTESGKWTREAVERQMSHQERDDVRAAYVYQAQHMQERRKMLQWWADYLDHSRNGFTPPYEFKWRYRK